MSTTVEADIELAASISERYAGLDAKDRVRAAFEVSIANYRKCHTTLLKTRTKVNRYTSHDVPDADGLFKAASKYKDATEKMWDATRWVKAFAQLSCAENADAIVSEIVEHVTSPV